MVPMNESVNKQIQEQTVVCNEWCKSTRYDERNYNRNKLRLWDLMYRTICPKINLSWVKLPEK